MIQLGGLHPDRSELEPVRGYAPARIRSMTLQIAHRRTTAGDAVVCTLALGSGAILLLLHEAKPTVKWKWAIASSSQTAGGTPEAAAPQDW